MGRTAVFVSCEAVKKKVGGTLVTRELPSTVKPGSDTSPLVRICIGFQFLTHLGKGNYENMNPAYY
jgi:hypothetical protein